LTDDEGRGKRKATPKKTAKAKPKGTSLAAIYPHKKRELRGNPPLLQNFKSMGDWSRAFRPKFPLFWAPFSS